MFAKDFLDFIILGTILENLLWLTTIPKEWQSKNISNKYFIYKSKSVEAITDLHLLVIEKHDFWFVFGDGKGGGGPIFHKLLNLLQARKSKALNTIQK